MAGPTSTTARAGAGGGGGGGTWNTLDLYINPGNAPSGVLMSHNPDPAIFGPGHYNAPNLTQRLKGGPAPTPGAAAVAGSNAPTVAMRSPPYGYMTPAQQHKLMRQQQQQIAQRQRRRQALFAAMGRLPSAAGWQKTGTAIGNLPTPGNLPLVLFVFAFFLLAIVPVNGGYTRLALLYLSLLGRATVPDDSTISPAQQSLFDIKQIAGEVGAGFASAAGSAAGSAASSVAQGIANLPGNVGSSFSSAAASAIGNLGIGR